jgi:hypothetical protein
LEEKYQYSVKEVNTFAKTVNFFLKDDEDAKCTVSINVEDKEEMLKALENGIIMCKLLMIIDPNCIDGRAINRDVNMSEF